MLTKETKQTAEQIKAELLSHFESAKKLGEKVQKLAKKTRHAEKVSRAWHWCSAYECEETGENLQEIEKLKAKNVKEWHNQLEKKWELYSVAETTEKVARLNYHNYLLFIAKLIAYKLRLNNNWRTFYDKKGLESLYELINEGRTSEKVYFYRDGGSISYSLDDPRTYQYINIVIWGECAINGKEWGSFKNRTQEDNEKNPLQEPEAPKELTKAQYLKLYKKIKECEKKAVSLCDEAYTIATKSGLIYFVDTPSRPQSTKWKIND